MTLDASTILDLAVAVFIGNCMTIALVKGYQRMKSKDDVDWIVFAYFVGPLAFTALTLWLADRG